MTNVVKIFHRQMQAIFYTEGMTIVMMHFEHGGLLCQTEFRIALSGSVKPRRK